jgi:hypothetical protein
MQMPHQTTDSEINRTKLSTNGLSIDSYLNSIGFKEALEFRVFLVDHLKLDRDKLRHRLKKRVMFTPLEKEKLQSLFVEPLTTLI